jgi:hypothetical protein
LQNERERERKIESNTIMLYNITVKSGFYDIA